MDAYGLKTAALGVCVWLAGFVTSLYFGRMGIVSSIILANLVVAVVFILMAARNLTAR